MLMITFLSEVDLQRLYSLLEEAMITLFGWPSWKRSGPRQAEATKSLKVDGPLSPLDSSLVHLPEMFLEDTQNGLVHKVSMT
jgi:hypothetical protein